MYIYIYIHIHTYTHIHIYIYIWTIYLKLFWKHSWTIYNNIINKTELVEAIRDLFGLFFLNYFETMLKYVYIYIFEYMSENYYKSILKDFFKQNTHVFEIFFLGYYKTIYF